MDSTLTLTSWLLTAAGCLGVGVLGGFLGVGGGIFLVPLLVFTASLRPVEAVGVSLFCIIGTSAGSSLKTLPSGEANLPLALFLEVPLVLGAVAASAFAYKIDDGVLLLLFSAVVFVVGLQVFIKGTRRITVVPLDQVVGASVFDGLSSGNLYKTRRLPLLFGLMGGAGAASGLFGIGGGALAIPVLTLVGKVPLKAASATSSLSLMVTAGAAGAVHLAQGHVSAPVVAAALVGVLPGGFLGARLQHLAPERVLQILFGILASGTAVFTAWGALS